ncbi:uncharacterized protein TNCV_97501 [Trichonephila clavipes]|nr:uncharacterized protein TNCV_97501 [Trichonephila clavipes]
MWEAPNTASLSICRTALAMSSRVANRLPRTGSLILGMKSKSQGQIKFIVTFHRISLSENGYFDNFHTIHIRLQFVLISTRKKIVAMTYAPTLVYMWPQWPSGRGNGSWLACQEFEPSTTKDPPYRGVMHVKSVEISNILPLENLGRISTELVYGKTVRLAGEFFLPTKAVSDPVQFVESLRTHRQKSQPKLTCSHGKLTVFAHNELHKCTHVFVKRDSIRRPLQAPYDDPYPGIKHRDKLNKENILSKLTSIPIDRIKLKKYGRELSPALFTSSRRSECFGYGHKLVTDLSRVRAHDPMKTIVLLAPSNLNLDENCRQNTGIDPL